MGLYDRFLMSSAEDLRSSNLYVAAFGELLGTMFLTYFGCSSVSSTSGNIVGIAFAFGFVVAAAVWVLASVSGGHLNPAVTIGLLVARRVSLVRAFVYVVAQIVGGIVGGALVLGLSCGWQAQLPTTTSCSFGTTLLSSGVTPGMGFGIELLITFLFVATVMAVVDTARTDLHDSGVGPLAIGIGIALGQLVAVPLTGAGMNPARSFGPAVVSGLWLNHWVYWVGPIVGGILAGLIYELLFSGDASGDKFVSWIKDPPPKQLAGASASPSQ